MLPIVVAGTQRPARAKRSALSTATASLVLLAVVLLTAGAPPAARNNGGTVDETRPVSLGLSAPPEQCDESCGSGWLGFAGATDPSDDRSSSSAPPSNGKGKGKTKRKRKHKSKKGRKSQQQKQQPPTTASVLPDDLPDDAKGLLKLGRDHVGSMPQTARHLFERALEVEPRSADAMWELGNLLMMNESMEDRHAAVRYLQAALELEPDLVEVHISMGVAHTRVRDRREAARSFRRALKKGGVDPDASAAGAKNSDRRINSDRERVVRSMLAEVLLDLGMAQKAHRQYETLLKGSSKDRAGPSQRSWLMGAARALAELGAHREAASRFSDACNVFEDVECLAGAASSLAWAADAERDAAGMARSDAAWERARQKAGTAKGQPGSHYGPGLLTVSKQLAQAAAEHASGTGSKGGLVFDGREMSVSILSTRPGPLVYRIEGFLGDEEADALAALYEQRRSARSGDPLVCFTPKSPALSAATKTLKGAGIAEAMQLIEDPSFSERLCANLSDPAVRASGVADGLSWSDSTFAFRGESALVDAVEDRLEAVAGLPRAHALSTQLLSYAEGVDYAEHTDCSMDITAADRAMTALVYLTDVQEGGETVFPRVFVASGDDGTEQSVAVKPVKGTAVVFSSFRATGGWCDPASLHASNAVAVGSNTKIAVQKWYMQRPLPTTAQGRHGDKMGAYTAADQGFVLCDKSTSCREYFPFSAGGARGGDAEL